MTKKVTLFSGKVLKVTGDDLTPDRFRFLRLAEAEPDLGTAPIDGSFLIGNLDNTREWTPNVFLTYPISPTTSLPVPTFNITGNLDVSGNINGIIDIEVAPAAINLPDGAIIKIGDDQVLSQTELGPTVVNSSLTSVGTISAGTWQGNTIEVPYGGTGRTSVTANAILYGTDDVTPGDGTGALGITNVGTGGQVLQVHPTNGTPIFDNLDGGGY